MRKRHVVKEYRSQLGTHDEIVTICGAVIPVRKGLIDPDATVTHSSKTACESCAMKANDEQLAELEKVCTEVPR